MTGACALLGDVVLPYQVTPYPALPLGRLPVEAGILLAATGIRLIDVGGKTRPGQLHRVKRYPRGQQELKIHSRSYCRFYVATESEQHGYSVIHLDTIGNKLIQLSIQVG